MAKTTNHAEMMPPVLQEVCHHFESVKKTEANHLKHALLLKKVYEKYEFNEFFEALKKVIYACILRNGDEKSANKCVGLLVNFVGVFSGTLKKVHVGDDEYKEDLLITELIEHLCETSLDVSDNMRFRSCEIINKITTNLTGLSLTLSERTSKNLCKTLLKRVEDNKAAVRLQAIYTLTRLQDPYDKEDKILAKFLHVMARDPAAQVRRLCVERIAMCPGSKVLDELLLRVQDVHNNVKISAMQRLGEFANCLNTSQRQAILSMGLDFSPVVKKIFISTILPMWYKSYNHNMLALLKGIRRGFEPKQIKRSLHFYQVILHDYFFKVSTQGAILHVLPLNEQKLIPLQELCWEALSYLRILLEYLQKSDDMKEIIEEILPEPIVFCKYVSEYCSSSSVKKSDNLMAYEKRELIIKQLFMVTRSFDYSDPPSRKALVDLILFTLKRVDDDMSADAVDAVVGNLNLLYKNHEERCRYICEIVSDILCPLDAENVPEQTFQEPQEAKINTDVPTLARCLDIACAGFMTLDKDTARIPASMQTFKKEILDRYDLLVHESDIIKCKAYRFYGMCAVLDKSYSIVGITLFSIPIIHYQEYETVYAPILTVCIGIVVDLLSVYGGNLVTEAKEHIEATHDRSVSEEHQQFFTESVSLTKILKGLLDLIDDEIDEVREKALLGLIKLILSERIESNALVSRLILRWCEPETGLSKEEVQEERFLKQQIAYLMERLPHLADSLHMMEGVFIETINSLFKAPKDDPLANVNVERIAKFILNLCKTSRHGLDIHNNIARSLCISIRDKPRAKINQLYSKILLMLDLSEKMRRKRKIRTLCDEILAVVSLKAIRTNITKLQAKLLLLENENKEN